MSFTRRVQTGWGWPKPLLKLWRWYGMGMTSDDTYDAGRTTNGPNDAPGAGPFDGMTIYDADDSGQGMSRQFDTLTL